jgi:glucokinase
VYIVGVDLGGTQLRAALSDASGRIYRRLAEPTKAVEGVEAVLSRLKDLLRQTMAGVPPTEIEAIGISAPGPLDPRAGVILTAPNLPGWNEVPLRHIIAAEFGYPTYLGNDANLAALAEGRFGAGRGLKDFIYITVSTGIGGGVITDGRLLLGERGLGAEVGHMTLEANGPRCNCGNIGCLEALASGTAIAREATLRLSEGCSSLISDMVQGDLSRVTGQTVYEAAQKGDPLAHEVFARAGFYLGVGLVNLLYLFNPSRIILGGSVMKAGDLILNPVWEVVRRRISRFYWERLSIVLADLGDDVGLLGAVALVLDAKGQD